MSGRQRPVDQRGRLELEPFSYVTTKDGQVRISYEGRVVTTVAGSQAERLARRLDAELTRVQLLLARPPATSSPATSTDNRAALSGV